MSQPSPNSDWTHGPAKWAAVLVLGTASITALAWSFLGRQPRPVYSPAVVQREPILAAPAPRPLEDADPSPSAPRQDAPIQQPDRAPAAPQALLAIPADTVAPPNIEQRPPDPAPSVARLININTASAAELELLPGIGPALAARIVEYRRQHGRFRSVDELDHVSGIGPRTLEKIRPHAAVK